MMPAQIVAAIDIGSNSVRVAVVRMDGPGTFEVIEEARAVPQLIRDVRDDQRLSQASLDFVVETLRDFQAIACGAGVQQMAAVATSAVRDAENGHELVTRIEEVLGIAVRVITGAEEAELAFLGAVRALPVEDGYVLDVGGGSIELIRFQARAVADVWSLQLGAVRLSDDFITSDPPSPQQLRALRKHLVRQLSEAGLPRLSAGELVGTGGTVRNLAKVDFERRRYPLPKIHGYRLAKTALRGVNDQLRAHVSVDRGAIDGLNSDRADSIIAGGMVVEAVMDALGAESLLVSGQGLREGLALTAVHGSLPSVEEVRTASVMHAAQLFAPTRLDIARRRVTCCEALHAQLATPLAAEVYGALGAAAALFDIGRAVDYYGHNRYAETLLQLHGLPGYSHRELALIVAILRQANSEKFDPLVYRPLITLDDRPAISAAAKLLAAAEATVLRAPDEAVAGVRREAAFD